MQIGSVIRKYRKECGLTQEEMAKRLGVTTPAVNKWENGNTNPDIELLAPIARLLHISLDTLLSFQEKLTDMEIETLIRQMGDKLEKEGFEKTYEWAVQITKKYPNCNMLIWQIAVMLDAGRITGACGNPEQYDEQINAWYEMVLQDENEEIQYHAADSLFGFYLRKKEYVAAEKYLNYFSEHDPMKKIFRFVGDDNIYIFGESSEQVIEHYAKADYVSRSYYDNDENIKRAIDFIVSDEMMAVGCRENLERLYNELLNKDWFMTLPDFEEYVAAKERIFADYEDRMAWAKKMLVNMSQAGFFSSDRTIAQYNEDIWHL